MEIDELAKVPLDVREFLPRTFAFDRPDLLNLPSREEWLQHTEAYPIPFTSDLPMGLVLRKGEDCRMLLETTLFRQVYTRYSFVILTQELIRDIAWLARKLDRTKVIDLAAGLGATSFWLNKAEGLPTEAIDSCDWPQFAGRWPGFIKKMTAEERLWSLHKREHTKTLFILSWPPYDNPMAERVWSLLPAGSCLLYMGESADGCCATDRFFAQAASSYVPELSDRMNQNYLRFMCLYDHASVYIKQ